MAEGDKGKGKGTVLALTKQERTWESNGKIYQTYQACIQPDDGSDTIIGEVSELATTPDDQLYFKQGNTGVDYEYKDTGKYGLKISKPRQNKGFGGGGGGYAGAKLQAAAMVMQASVLRANKTGLDPVELFPQLWNAVKLVADEPAPAKKEENKGTSGVDGSPTPPPSIQPQNQQAPAPTDADAPADDADDLPF